MILINNLTGKPVDASEENVSRLLAAGFTKPEEKRDEEPPAPKSRRSRKSE